MMRALLLVATGRGYSQYYAHCGRILPMLRDRLESVDLDVHVAIRTVDGQQVLSYTLGSPSGVVPLTHRQIQIRPLHGLDIYRDRLIRRLEKLQNGMDVDDAPLLLAEVEYELENLGRELYRELFPPEMRLMYRQWRDKVRTLQINCEVPWIPWELVRPYEDDLQPVIDDDFLGARFDLTRWLVGDSAPAGTLRIARLACIEAGTVSAQNPLPHAGRERDLLAQLSIRHPGVEDASLSPGTYSGLTELLQRGGVGLLHFVGHGEFSSKDPDYSKILLADGRNFRAGQLQGPLQRQIRVDRPLVFFNACGTAREDWVLTGLGGWANAWVNRCGVGAFIAPQLPVRDSLAYEFARIFYLGLERGRSLGRATRLARLWVRRRDRRHTTWLAFAVYGHPNARVSFGAKSA